MPRPGPRPYECIRRAWHSDSHQPLRGTLIREIFRVVNELHSTSTRRKKEWQEKLPIVVLRAEEILYSKANSEGEYADVETLSSRLNDAVNTMIRKEDGEEEGVYLMPCVEAALSLGCLPKKASRGHRQAGSRHPQNAARRVSPAAGPVVKENCVVGNTTSMDSVRTSQERHPSSAFSLMGTQNSSMQEQDLRSIPHLSSSSLFSPAGALWGPSTCYPPNVSFIPPHSPSFHKSLDVSHPVGLSSFPTPGALVQFLRSTETCRYSGYPQPDTIYATPQMHFNVNQELRPLQLLDSAESSGARMSSRVFCGDVGVRASKDTPPLCSSGSPPPCMISSLSQDMSAENQNKPSLGAAPACFGDSVCHSVMRNALPSSFDMGKNAQKNEFPCLPVRGGHASSMPNIGTSLSPSWCKINNTVSLQRISSRALSGIDDSSTSLSGAHDLQLRLGPPVNASVATSVSTVDASAPKRMRVDIPDPSAIQID